METKFNLIFYVNNIFPFSSHIKLKNIETNS